MTAKKDNNFPFGAYSKGVFDGIRDVDELRLIRDVCCRVMLDNHLCPDSYCNDCPCEKEFEETLLKCD